MAVGDAIVSSRNTNTLGNFQCHDHQYRFHADHATLLLIIAIAITIMHSIYRCTLLLLLVAVVLSARGLLPPSPRTPCLRDEDA